VEQWSARIAPAFLDEETVSDFTWVLVRQNVRYLERYQAPELYASGVWYQPDELTCDAAERICAENWLPIPYVIERARMGDGSDCKCLAAWRVAELRMRGVDARPRVLRQASRLGRPLYHVDVALPNERSEDPSRILGMR
jgi:hypothetical protein